MLFYVSFSYFMDVISSLFPLRILIIVWGVLLVNSYFLSSSLFQSCFFWSWMFTLDVFFQCLAYLLWLNCQLTALRWGLWIRSFPQGDVVRQYPERNAGIPIFPLKLVRFPRYDSFNLLPGKIYALLLIFWELLKRKQRMLIFSLYLTPLLEPVSMSVSCLGDYETTKSANLNSKLPQYKVKRFEFFTRYVSCLPSFDLQTKTNFSDVSLSQCAVATFQI